jgi:hypothetical protein
MRIIEGETMSRASAFSDRPLERRRGLTADASGVLETVAMTA